MDDRVIIVKGMRDKMEMKIRRKVNRSFAPDEYVKILNPRDSNDLALFFEDMVLLMNSPIEKAFRKFQERQYRRDRSPFI